ncbi:MAG: hypothetical protein ACI9OJ_003957 [Myxococcota bacterium]|jgi:hypothetical protein
MDSENVRSRAMNDETRQPEADNTATTSDAANSNDLRQPYVAPSLRSTEAFERMALLSCGADSTQPEECDEL